MKITAQEEYGLGCILQLAREEGNLELGGAMQVRDIAEREGLSVAYVEKILWTLSRRGIVESVRGPKGGYRLMRPSAEIISRTMTSQVALAVMRALSQSSKVKAGMP